MRGIGVSPGIINGKSFVIREENIIFPSGKPSNYKFELQKYKNSLEKVIDEIVFLKEKMSLESDESSIIFDAQLEMVQDPEMTKEIESSIKEGNYAINAVKNVTDNYIKIFENIEDEYLRARALDVDDIRKKLYRKILGLKEKSLEVLPANTIIIANDITPSDIATMDKANVVGFVTEIGGSTSHTAIIARNLGIPAVMGISNLTEKIEDNIEIVIDGTKGDVIIPKDINELNEYKEKIILQNKIRKSLDKVKFQKAVTIDHKEIHVFSNIGNPEEAVNAVAGGAGGIGLFRSEFLYMNSSDFPSEEMQFAAYKETLDNMDGRPIIFRTLDVGGDKNIPYFDLPKEENPFLGWRAIRIFLDREDLFITQLRALLRASAFGEVLIMYPMISSIEEIEKTNIVMEKAKKQLREENIEFDEKVKIGIMVEIPSVAVIADKIADYIDFFSIGTNDLTQYTLACDRVNKNVSKYYDSFQPGVLHLINNVIKVGNDKEKLVGMCGELAGNPLATVLLIGMGLKEFSMSSSSIPKIKKIIMNVSYEEAKKVAENVLNMCRSEDIVSYLNEVLTSMELEYLLEI